MPASCLFLPRCQAPRYLPIYKASRRTEAGVLPGTQCLRAAGNLGDSKAVPPPGEGVLLGAAYRTQLCLLQHF